MIESMTFCMGYLSSKQALGHWINPPAWDGTGVPQESYTSAMEISVSAQNPSLPSCLGFLI